MLLEACKQGMKAATLTWSLSQKFSSQRFFSTQYSEVYSFAPWKFHLAISLLVFGRHTLHVFLGSYFLCLGCCFYPVHFHRTFTGDPLDGLGS